MGYRIQYGKAGRSARLWWCIGLGCVLLAWGAALWGGGLYDDLARMVGGMIRGAR